MMDCKNRDDKVNVLFIVFGVLLFFVLSFVLYEPNKGKSVIEGTEGVQGVERDDSSNSKWLDKDSVAVIEHDWCDCGYGLRCVCGLVVNNTDRDVRYVFVEINLYDESGVQTDSVSPSISNLEAHGKWEFKRHVYDDSVSTYKIKNIRYR